MREGNVPGALTQLDKALELDPSNAQAHLLVGYIHMNRGALDEAEAPMRRGIAILETRPDMASTLAEARNLLGTLLLERGDLEEAAKSFRASAADVLNTAPFFAWGNLGRTLYMLERYDEAKQALEQAVRIQARFCVGHYWMGRVHRAESNLEQAEASFSAALEVDPRCGETYQAAFQMRGETRARLGDRSGAVSDFEKCLQLGAQSEEGRACKRYLERGVSAPAKTPASSGQGATNGDDANADEEAAQKPGPRHESALTPSKEGGDAGKCRYSLLESEDARAEEAASKKKTPAVKKWLPSESPATLWKKSVPPKKLRVQGAGTKVSFWTTRPRAGVK